MPQYKHILTDFKDLRKVIGEVTKSKPAKTQYQQQAEKMGYKGKKKKKWNEPLKGFPGNEGVDEAEAQPGDQKKAGKLKKMKDHAGEEEIKKAYIELGTAAQGSVEFQRKLIQKKLKEKVSQQKHDSSFGKTSAWDTANPKPGRLKIG